MKSKKKKRQQQQALLLSAPPAKARREHAPREKKPNSVTSASALRDAVSSNCADTEVKARKVFAALLAPTSVSEFYSEYFESQCLLITERPPDYLDGWLTPSEVRSCAGMKSGIDVDVTRFDGIKRENVGKYGETCDVVPPGATVRLRTPHEHFPAVQRLCKSLEDEFGSTTSANAYLTPAGTQGFAPHYDDVDVFILQTHGRKRWRVYRPTRDELKLPRYSSPDYEGDSFPGYKQVLDHVLEPGHMIYMPRGFIHQANALNDSESLHLTLSTHRQNCWADFMETLLGLGLDKMSSATRASMPKDYLHVFGVQHAGNYEEDAGEELEEDEDDLALVTAARFDPEIPGGRRAGSLMRHIFREKAKELLEGLVEASLASLDDAADEMATRFIAERQPPSPHPEKKKKKSSVKKISHTTLVHSAERRQARLVVEGEKALLYHSRQNSPAHRKNPVALLEFDVEDAPAIEALLASHPARPVSVDQLPLPTLDEKLAMARTLYLEGLLVVATPPRDDDEDST